MRGKRSRTSQHTKGTMGDLRVAYFFWHAGLVRRLIIFDFRHTEGISGVTEFILGLFRR